MLVNILIGSGLIVITVFMHAVAMSLAVRTFRLTRADRRIPRTGIGRASVVSAVVLIMFVMSMLETVVWAAAYMVLGAFSDAETAGYFSAVAYTTLGFGDVVMEGRWRLLSAMEAANGIIIFGWTTAVIFVAIQHVYLGVTRRVVDPTKEPNDV